jgi:calcineurin-like phosphoesterase
MVGPLNGVIGMRQQEVIAKFVTGLPQRFTPENDFPAQLNMTLLEFAANKVVSITPINEIHQR